MGTPVGQAEEGDQDQEDQVSLVEAMTIGSEDDPPRTVRGRLMKQKVPGLGYTQWSVNGHNIDPDTIKEVPVGRRKKAASVKVQAQTLAEAAKAFADQKQYGNAPKKRRRKKAEPTHNLSKTEFRHLDLLDT